MDYRVILGVVMRTNILRLDVPFCVNKSQVHVSNYFYVLLTMHISIILGNDKLDTQLLYFTVCLL